MEERDGNMMPEGGRREEEEEEEEEKEDDKGLSWLVKITIKR